MTNQIDLQDQVNKLQDTVNALNAICQHYLIERLGAYEGAKKYGEYLDFYKQDAIAERAKQEALQELRDNLNTVMSDYRERANSMHWELVLMDEDKRKDCLKKLWNECKTDFELPKGTKQPSITIPQPTFEDLVKRKAEVQGQLDHINTTYLNDCINHSEKRIKEIVKYTEAKYDKAIGEAKRKDKITEADRESQVTSLITEKETVIKRGVSQEKRRIDSAKASLKCHERLTHQLSQVNELIKKSL
ncbi:DUF3922 domain-containing protein [Aliiglaciecola lipolytica]|uniref:DUF3922 domain-containing protein n=1 Tax=Aliiglaciecola lipolytica TaxID=477689 RepID=UPI001C086BDA|nr:DUF3922 domain-containing protein [Aliiglaciecola lipolytica]MBU2877590.1 DUF3922 domain-containing protein [Aliiglaciecola lipolytica]